MSWCCCRWWVEMIVGDELIRLRVIRWCGRVDIVDSNWLKFQANIRSAADLFLTVWDVPHYMQSYWGMCECRGQAQLGYKRYRAGGTGRADDYGWRKYSIWLDLDQQHLTWEDVLHWTISAQKSMMQSSSTAPGAVQAPHGPWSRCSIITQGAVLHASMFCRYWTHHRVKYHLYLSAITLQFDSKQCVDAI